MINDQCPGYVLKIVRKIYFSNHSNNLEHDNMIFPFLFPFFVFAVLGIKPKGFYLLTWEYS
jgi:hypothetical protein